MAKAYKGRNEERKNEETLSRIRVTWYETKRMTLLIADLNVGLRGGIVRAEVSKRTVTRKLLRRPFKIHLFLSPKSPFKGWRSKQLTESWRLQFETSPMKLS